MDFAIARQPDGSYVLRFQQASLRAEIALTEVDLAALVMKLQVVPPEHERGR